MKLVSLYVISLEFQEPMDNSEDVLYSLKPLVENDMDLLASEKHQPVQWTKNQGKGLIANCWLFATE